MPLPPLDGLIPPISASFKVRSLGDPEVAAAKEELDTALPPRWRLFDSDQERYFFPNGYLETFAVAAAGPGREGELVLGIGEDGAFRTLAKRLRGELDVTEAWAAPMNRFTPK